VNHEERFLSRRQQAERYGKSVKTVERWGLDPTLGFPGEYDINSHKFRKLSELEAWERSRAAIAATAPRRHWPAKASDDAKAV
jgi:hypothetical protein